MITFIDGIIVFFTLGLGFGLAGLVIAFAAPPIQYVLDKWTRYWERKF